MKAGKPDGTAAPQAVTADEYAVIVALRSACDADSAVEAAKRARSDAANAWKAAADALRDADEDVAKAEAASEAAWRGFHEAKRTMTGH